MQRTNQDLEPMTDTRKRHIWLVWSQLCWISLLPKQKRKVLPLYLNNWCLFNISEICPLRNFVTKHEGIAVLYLQTLTILGSELSFHACVLPFSRSYITHVLMLSRGKYTNAKCRTIATSEVINTFLIHRCHKIITSVTTFLCSFVSPFFHLFVSAYQCDPQVL